MLMPVTEGDRHDLHQLFARKETRTISGDAAQGKEFQRRFDAMTGQSGHHWVIRLTSTNEFVGCVSIAPHAGGQDQEISYQVQKQFWSTGLAGEAVSAVMDYAAQTLKLPSLVAETRDANEPSKNILKRLGMTFEGTVLRGGEKQAIFRKILTA